MTNNEPNKVQNIYRTSKSDINRRFMSVNSARIQSRSLIPLGFENLKTSEKLIILYCWHHRDQRSFLKKALKKLVDYEIFASESKYVENK